MPDAFRLTIPARAVRHAPYRIRSRFGYRIEMEAFCPAHPCTGLSRCYASLIHHVRDFRCA